MYLWLKDRMEERLEELKKQGRIGNLSLHVDNLSGKKYVFDTVHVGDPTSTIPEALNELVEQVTVRETIHTGFRYDGIYRVDDAVLTASHTGDSQELRISGPSVESVNTIYSLFRQDKLQPEENWGNAQVIEPAAARETSE